MRDRQIGRFYERLIGRDVSQPTWLKSVALGDATEPKYS